MRQSILAFILCAWSVAGCAPTPPPQETSSPAQRATNEPTLQPRTPMLERAWSRDPQKFSFMILGDKTGGGEENWPIFDRAVEEINRLHPDFVVMVGDLIQGYVRDTSTVAAMWEEFWQHAGRLRVPFFFLPGNHDVSYPEMLNWWKRHNGRTYYSFDYKGCHFLMLNTDEVREGMAGNLGPEQLRFALDDLAAHADARHTFIFMHKPAWHDPNYRAEWEQIERVLNGRKYTVFAGHWHHLEYYVRNGRRYFVLSATGAGLRPSEVKPFGSFHHYTHVTVDGDSAHIAIIEPGAIWPQDIAPRAFRQAAYELLRARPLAPEGLGTPEVKPGFVVTVNNRLPDTVVVHMRIEGAEPEVWRIVEGSDSVTVTVAPNARRTVTTRFVTPAAHLPEVPQVSYEVRYDGAQMFSWRQKVALFPDSLLRPVPEWEVAGPFDAGTVNFEALPDYRAAIPRAFERLGPEEGWRPDATFSENGKTLGWRRVSADEAGRVILDTTFGTPTPMNAIAYALCGIYSPEAQTVYAVLQEDDFAQVLLNGQMREEGKLYRTRRDVAYLSLPLEKGWNTVIVKVINMGGGWSFRLAVADPAGALRFAAHPAGQ